MIFVDRSGVAEPQELAVARAMEQTKLDAYYADANIKAMRQKIAALQPVGNGSKKRGATKDPKSYEFKAYRRAKIALETLFHKKCAYCETKYKASSGGEVEHYRPKGTVLTSEGKRSWPGYYWLASTWSNLVPVCELCNKKNTFEDLTDGQTRVVGKGENFPLADETTRAKNIEALAGERPLLIDPCDPAERPERHLQVGYRDAHGPLMFGVTEPGRATVRIIGLNRVDLVTRRAEHVARLTGLMKDIERATLQAAEATTASQKRVALDEIVEKKTTLERMMLPESEYTALTRFIVEPFLAKMQTLTADAAR